MPVSKQKKAATQTKITGALAPPQTLPPEVGTSPPTPATAAAPATSSVVDQPPTEPMPQPAVGFSPIDLEEFRGTRPRAAQAAIAPTVATELKSSTDYEARFGKNAPSQSTIASAVALAAEWRTVRTAVEAYLAYVLTEDALAWKTAMTLMRQLAPLFEAASKVDATIANEYPGLTRFFNAPEVITKVGVATRAKKAKAKVAAATETTVSNAVNAALAQQVTGAGAPVAAPATPITAASPVSPVVKKH